MSPRHSSGRWNPGDHLHKNRKLTIKKLQKNFLKQKLYFIGPSTLYRHPPGFLRPQE
ncbi:MAG: hypothetical protein K2W97_01515 [Chthoniobacterales bacterium]|nr:hypothetical protein [Chthoniobacterales bacterium]